LIKDIPSQEHLDIEKARLFFIENPCLHKPYKIVGLLALFKLLNDTKHYNLLVLTYGIDDGWYHEQMGRLDLNSRQLIDDLAERDKVIMERDKVIMERDKVIMERDKVIMERDVHIFNLNKIIDETLRSTSWRLTRPVRFVGHQLLKIKSGSDKVEK
jgi:hypothetical protein